MSRSDEERLADLLEADNKDAAARILKERGGDRLIHFGKGHWESLG